MPGLGDVARGLFGSSLAAVNFAVADTFGDVELHGSGVSARKTAFLSVARTVGSRLEHGS